MSVSIASSTHTTHGSLGPTAGSDLSTPSQEPDSTGRQQRGGAVVTATWVPDPSLPTSGREMLLVRSKRIRTKAGRSGTYEKLMWLMWQRPLSLQQ